MLNPHKVRMFCIRGLLGAVYSTGMNDLAVEANKIPGVSATAEGNSLFPVTGVVGNLTEACYAASEYRKIVLVGHSYGAYAAMVIAAQLAAHKIDVPLLVMDDTTVDSPLVPDTGGVRIQYFQKVDPMGGGTPDSVLHARTKLERIQLNLVHIQMDKSPTVHTRILEELRKIVGVPTH